MEHQPRALPPRLNTESIENTYRLHYDTMPQLHVKRDKLCPLSLGKYRRLFLPPFAIRLIFADVALPGIADADSFERTAPIPELQRMLDSFFHEGFIVVKRLYVDNIRVCPVSWLCWC